MKAYKIFTNKPLYWLVISHNENKTIHDAIEAWEKSPLNHGEILLRIEETK